MKRIHIISRAKNKWAVVLVGKKKAIKVFDYREKAYWFAANLYPKIDTIVYVHETNGSVLFYEHFSPIGTFTITLTNSEPEEHTLQLGV